MLKIFPSCLFVLICLVAVAGCESKNKVVLPDQPLTEQQIKEVQAEDTRISEEESQGTYSNAAEPGSGNGEPGT